MAKAPAVRLPAPCTVVVTIVELSMPRGLHPQVVLAFGASRVADSTAAFEAHDAASEELDVEIWDCGPDAVVGSAATRLLGTCTIGVSHLLMREAACISDAFPVTGTQSQFLGIVDVLVEMRPSGHATRGTRDGATSS